LNLSDVIWGVSLDSVCLRAHIPPVGDARLFIALVVITKASL